MGKSILLKVLPRWADEIERISYLSNSETPPVVSVLGKYNHGKSTLLNALVGQEVFRVSDIRETTALYTFEHDGIEWLDTPGLDADVAADDDRLARQGAWTEADIRLFVHSVREGELDRTEQELIHALRDDCEGSRRKVFAVLTQIEQVEDEDALRRILETTQRQLQGLEFFPVSAARYSQGIERNKPILIKRSGLPELLARIKHAALEVPGNRKDEIATLSEILLGDLERSQASHTAKLARQLQKKATRLDTFDREFHDLRTMLHHKLNEA
ncbi:GTPase [Cupriavidus basilensis]|uniref:GTPase n=1 Tax=Cupriavidus basilensis TaxID=68895 RepID=UPI0023E83A91|nr:GTPase [Cupriavidus basilensis]MDF3883263.1 50S ribosome-binding GTPase [Cupriavidus basilensis]